MHRDMLHLWRVPAPELNETAGHVRRVLVRREALQHCNTAALQHSSIATLQGSVMTTMLHPVSQACQHVSMKAGMSARQHESIAMAQCRRKRTLLEVSV